VLLAKKDEHQKNLEEVKDEYASASESVKANEQSLLAKAEKELKAATKELGDMQKEPAATTQKESAAVAGSRDGARQGGIGEASRLVRSRRARRRFMPRCSRVDSSRCA